MKKCIFFISLLFAFALHANPDTFSKDRLIEFYDIFLEEEKVLLDEAGLSSSTPLSVLRAPTFSPPPNPPAPPFMAGLLPVVLVNNSTLPDSQVYIVVTGKDETFLNQSFVQFNGSGVGTLITANPGDNATNYSYLLSSLPTGSTGRVIYLPKIVGGVIWFSMNQSLNMPVNAPHNIVQPNFLSSADPNYNTNYDIFEVTYVSTGTNIAADATAVSFFSIPLYGFISTPAPGSAVNTGLYQPRSFIMSSVQTQFTAAPESSQWNTLFLRNGSNILRLLSPGKAMSASIFDQNYLDNAAAYTYSYISDIWSGSSSFYRNPATPLKLTIPNGSLDTYQGVINPDNTITFTSSPHGYTVVLAAPTTTNPTTTFDIFSGLFFIVSDNSPGAADGIQLSKLLEEAIIAGIVPTANTLSNPYLQSIQNQYYTINPNLSHRGQTLGPWYDLYSKSLHSLGFIYTFAYDEPLWPQVQIFSNTLIPNSTYIGVTIGSVQ